MARIMTTILLPILLAMAGFLQVAIAEPPSGYELAQSEMRQKHLDHFMQLYREFCFGRASMEDAESLIKKSRRFKPAKDFDGIYEEQFGNISYAITPDPEFCTVDVKLAYKEGRLLFSQSEMENAIASLPEYAYQVEKRLQEIHDGPAGEAVSVEMIEFYPAEARDNRILLIYPKNHQDVYYMTLDFNYR